MLFLIFLKFPKLFKFLKKITQENSPLTERKKYEKYPQKQ